MTILLAGLQRVAKLFVDDKRFACAIVAWLVAAIWLMPFLPSAAGWRPILLFGGLAAILLAEVHRAARLRLFGCGFQRSRPGIPSIIRAPFQSDGAHHSNLMAPGWCRLVG